MFRNVLLATILAACAGVAMGGNGNRFETPYYVIETDLTLQDAREAAVRLTSMFEEYNHIAKLYIQEVKKRPVCRVFSKEEDFVTAGGGKNMAGYYDPATKNLNILFSRESKDYSWRTIQHEGFHQFADTSDFGTYAPAWMNEGLAEYFGKGLWTGNGLKTGAVSNRDLEQIQGYIADKKLLPFPSLMVMEQKEWNKADGDDQQRNYAQSWSMIHFLYHAENGKYVRPLTAFALALRKKVPSRFGRGQYWKEVWKSTFGTDLDAFQRKYSEWWSSLPRNSTRELYVSATVETLDTFLSRAFAQGQKFKDYDDFIDAAGNGKVVLKDDIHVWLPPGLLTKALKDAARLKTWSLEPEKSGRPKLVLRRSNGQMLTATFLLKANRPPEVQVLATRLGRGAAIADASPVDAKKWQFTDRSADGADTLLLPFGKELTLRVRRKSYDPAHQEFAIQDREGCPFRYLTKGRLNTPQTEYRGFYLDEDVEPTTAVDVDADGDHDYTIWPGKDRVSIYADRQWIKTTMKDLNPANGVVNKDGDAYAFDLRAKKWVGISKAKLEKMQAEAAATSQSRPATMPDSPQADLTRKWDLAERKPQGTSGAQTLVIPIGEDVAANITINPDHPEQNEVSLTQTDSDKVIFIYKAKGLLGAPEVRYSGQVLCEPDEEETHIDLNADGDFDCILMEGGERLKIDVNRKWIEATSKDMAGMISTEDGKFKFDTKARKWVPAK